MSTTAPLLSRAREPATRFILIEPSHAGNVGAAARAIKVMGFGQLALVRPRWSNVLARKETLERSSGAHDVLERALVCESLDEALSGMSHICATVMTARDFGPPTRAPRPHLEHLLSGDEGAWPRGVAFVFGCERFGMSNADVYRCHVALSIESCPTFGSLNLAAALQLIAYEWRQALLAKGLGYEAQAGQVDAGGPSGERGGVGAEGAVGQGDRHGQGCEGVGAAGGQARGDDQERGPPALARGAGRVMPRELAADGQQVAGFLRHWERALIHLEFLDPHNPKKLMARLAQLFNRANLTVAEIDILRGIAKAMEGAQVAGRAKSVSAALGDAHPNLGHWPHNKGD